MDLARAFFTHETQSLLKTTQMPNSTEIDLTKLAALVAKKRNGRRLRDIAEEIEVSAPTLSRIEKGHLPDLDTFIKLCRWLKVSPDDFQLSQQQKLSDSAINTRETVCAFLRADRTLPPSTANALTTMIELAYKDVQNGTFDDQ